MLCGDVTIESLISTEAADELGIETGSPAVVTAAATQVIVERACSATAALAFRDEISDRPARRG